MKKLFNALLVIFFTCFSGSMYAMKHKNNSTLTNQAEALWLPDDVITHIAGYSWPKEKNILMRLSQVFCECLKNRTSILKANLLTVSLFDKVESMIEYARVGNTEMTEFLLKNSVKATCKNVLGISPFHVASENAHVKAMQLLATYGADVNELKPHVHPLHEAAYKGDAKVIQAQLTELKINPNLTMADGTNALFIASAKRHTDIVKSLIDAGATQGNSASLLIASRLGHVEIVKLLLAVGADVNCSTKDKTTALIYASQNDHIKIVKLLIDAGVDVDHRAIDGTTSLMVASENGHAEIAKLLLAAGADVNHASNNKMTALMWASKNGCTEIIKLLIDARAEVNHANNNKMAALMYASLNDHIKIVKLLINAGADVDHRAIDGTTSLMVASTKGHTEIVKLLLAAVAKVDHANNNQVTALMCASQKGYIEIVKLLIDAGADVNQANKKGLIPLFVALCGGNIKMVKLLLATEIIDVNKSDIAGWTSLCGASYKGNTEIAKLLLAAGANVHQAINTDSATDLLIKQGDTPLQIAQKKGHTEIVELLYGQLQHELQEKKIT